MLQLASEVSNLFQTSCAEIYLSMFFSNKFNLFLGKKKNKQLFQDVEKNGKKHGELTFPGKNIQEAAQSFLWYFQWWAVTTAAKAILAFSKRKE